MPATPAPAVNFLPYAKCARAFWSQQEVPSYRRLLKDTLAWLDPRPGEHWLDLGCGSGQLTAGLWTKSEGTLAQVTASDCAAVNEQALEKLRRTVQPPASEEQIPFVQLDFSNGLPLWNDETFDGVMSGLAVQYAECYSLERGCWTTEAYDRLLAEVCRVLRPGGALSFRSTCRSQAGAGSPSAPCTASCRHANRRVMSKTLCACSAMARGSPASRGTAASIICRST